jgi:hypothetical protein
MMNKSQDVLYGRVLRLLCLGNIVSIRNWRDVSMVPT